MPLFVSDRASLQHKNAKHFRYESLDSPWHGPVKRARQALLDGLEPSYSPEEYLDYLKKTYPKIYDSLEWVQFFRFQPGRKFSKNLPEGFIYRLAVSYLKPDPEVRDSLFVLGEVITTHTGWYPLVMGSKAKPTIPESYLTKGDLPDIPANAAQVDIGNIQQVRDVSAEEGGISVLVAGSKGTLLFDTGFNVFTDDLDELKAVCVSHFHQDHCGGVWEIFNEFEFPLFLAEPTLRYLWHKKDKDPAARRRLIQYSRLVENESLSKDPHDGLNCFPVFHAPGSYGFYYTDSAGKCLIYPGDLCLKNGFLDYSEALFTTIQQIPATQKWVLLDAAMIRHADYSISYEDHPFEVIQEVIEAVQKRNVTFISRSPETLIYSLILTYLSTQGNQKTKKIKLVVNNTLHEVNQSLLGPMLYHDYQHIDPFVLAVMKKAVKNFVESFRVYPISSMPRISLNEKVITFATPPEITVSSDLQSRIRKGDVVLAGTLAITNDIPEEINMLCPRSILRVSSPDWCFHSSTDDLKTFIKSLTATGVHTILFHCEPEKANGFISVNGLDKRFVHAHSVDGVNIE